MNNSHGYSKNSKPSTNGWIEQTSKWAAQVTDQNSWTNSLGSCQIFTTPVPGKEPAYLRAVKASSKALVLVMLHFYFE